MAKQIRAARHYQHRNDPLRRIADRAIPGVKRDLLVSLRGLRELIPSDVVDKYARHADWTGLKDVIDWHHFRESLKGVFGHIGKAREAGAQHGAQEINAAFASAGRKVRFRKYSPDQPRDDHGRWASGGGSSSASISVGGKDITVSLSRVDQAVGYRLVNIDVHTFNAAWSRDHEFYVGPQGSGKGTIIGRYERFGEWIRNHDHDHMEASSAGVQSDGRVGFDNGRHRFAWLRDQGLKTVPVAMDRQSIENARRHGYLSEKVLKFTLSPLLGIVRKDANDQYTFDLYSQEVQDELRAAQDALIVGLEQDVRDSIDAIIMDAAQRGLGPEEIVDSIRDLIGLTDRQVAAVGNYRSMLENLDPGALDRQLRNVLEDDVVQQAIDDQTDLAAAYIDKMTGDYVDNYLDYRAETIVQSEVTRAVNAGLQDSYSQAIDRGVFPSEAVRQFWRINPDACEICQSIPDMNPDGVAMDEAFDSIDGPQDAPPDPHPHCFCSLEIVTDLDMVSTDDVDAGEAA